MLDTVLMLRIAMVAGFAALGGLVWYLWWDYHRMGVSGRWEVALEVSFNLLVTIALVFAGFVLWTEMGG